MQNRFSTFFQVGLLVTLFTTNSQAATILVPVPTLGATPTIDGNVDDWNGATWLDIPIKPAIENDAKNPLGTINVKLAVGKNQDSFFMAAKWPDSSKSVEYRNWKWRGKKYKRGKQKDDMFAVRFDMEGDYYECMFSNKDYKVDVWKWSSGRSDQAALAEDYVQIISTNPLENAAEYTMPDGAMVYIKKIRDEGSEIYQNTKPNRKKNKGKELPGIEMLANPSGSLIDVKAKGIWNNGEWTLEMSRKLDTGNADDVSLSQVKTIKGAIAVFNKAGAEHKSFSETMVFDFSQ